MEGGEGASGGSWASTQNETKPKEVQFQGSDRECVMMPGCVRCVCRQPEVSRPSDHQLNTAGTELYVTGINVKSGQGKVITYYTTTFHNILKLCDIHVQRVHHRMEAGVRRDGAR